MGFTLVALLMGCGKGLPIPDAMKAELPSTQKGLRAAFRLHQLMRCRLTKELNTDYKSEQPAEPRREQRACDGLSPCSPSHLLTHPAVLLEFMLAVHFNSEVYLYLINNTTVVLYYIKNPSPTR